MVDASGEVDLGRLEGIVGGEVNGKEENTSRVWRIAGSHDRCLPVKQVFAYWASRAGRRRVTAEVSELLVDALESHIG